MPSQREPQLAVSDDALLGGRVRFLQPEAGYRVNVDSLLLARFACHGRGAKLAVDLGAGVGLVSLLLAHFDGASEFVLVEREASVAEVARENLLTAGVTGQVLELDVSDAALRDALPNGADLVVSNPPFYKHGEHRRPHDAQRERARLGELGPFVAAAARLLTTPKARAAFVYPARALSELFACAEQHKLVPKRLQLVHAFVDRPARLALVELRRARPGGLVVEPPLVEWQEPGVPSAALRELSAGPTNDRK